MEMMQNMGVSVVTLPGAEVLPALERGAVDGAEWAIPSHDILIGFHNVTKYYYMPDLRQPASLQDLLINTSVWAALPDDLKSHRQVRLPGRDHPYGGGQRRHGEQGGGGN